MKRVVKDCRICSKFAKSVSRPKVRLPKPNLLNKVVTMDLKSFGLKCVLWIIDSFSRFVQGKVLHNKKTETIINAVMDT